MVPVELALVLFGVALLALQWRLARRRPALRAPFAILPPPRQVLPGAADALPRPRGEAEETQMKPAALV